jgi:uncharacterized protein YndB with AHSA1/START domain
MTPSPASAAPAQLEASIEIAAPPAQVWALVTDLPRMREWSPMTRRTWVRGGTVRQGARFANLNGSGLKAWPTTGKVVRFTPHSDFAFRIAENRVVWSYALEPTADGGTRVTSRRETPDGISALSTTLTKVVLGGVPGFTDELQRGMQATLERLKAAAES